MIATDVRVRVSRSGFFDSLPRKIPTIVLAAGLAISLMHCAQQGGDSLDKAGVGGGGGVPCVGPSCGGGTAGGMATGGSAGLPPEKEVESSFESPVATGRYVWAANPDSGRVALVDAKKIEVRTVEGGFGPTYLAAVPNATQPDLDQAIVINVKSKDATFFRVDSAGQITARNVPIHAGANAWAISPAGRWAIAWTNSSALPSADPTEGFQDITVIDLAGNQPIATRLSVGYRPARLFFSNDEARAFVVTEPGITLIDLATGPAVTMDVAVTDDPLDNHASRDVSITGDGKYALVRRDGSAQVGVVSLETAERVTVTLSGPVTDLDLAADGARAIAVVRAPGGEPSAAPDGGTAPPDAGGESAEAGDAADDATTIDAAQADASPPAPPPSSQVFLLPIPGIFDAPASYDKVTIDGEIVGSVSVSEKGDVALLYTNAMPDDHLTILTTVAGTSYLAHRTVALKAPVEAVFPAPDSAHAVALLAPGGISSKPGAFSLVPIAQDLPPKIQGTDAKPFSVTIAPPPSSRALVTVRDDLNKTYAVYLSRMPELQVDKIGLASPPLASGMVPAAGVGWVAQQHPEGRITFVDLANGNARTLTGFELGAKVVDGTP